MTYEAWVEGRLSASGPTFGALDGCTFRLDLDGTGESEWRIHDPAREEPVVIRGGSSPAIIVDGQLLEVIPAPYGELLALQHFRGWVVSKAVRSSAGLIDALEVLDFAQGSTGSAPIDVTPDTFDDWGPRPSWRMGSADG